MNEWGCRRQATQHPVLLLSELLCVAYCVYTASTRYILHPILRWVFRTLTNEADREIHGHPRNLTMYTSPSSSP
jgi:hypothetical protein